MSRVKHKSINQLTNKDVLSIYDVERLLETTPFEKKRMCRSLAGM